MAIEVITLALLFLDKFKNSFFENNFDLTLNVQKNKVQGRRSIPYGKIEKIEFPTHSIDAFRNKIGVEVEWNNKTEFYDRDLGNFRLLNELKILDATFSSI